MKTFLFSLLILTGIFLNAQNNGVQIISGNTSIQTSFGLGSTDTINMWYSGSVLYNAQTGIATIYFVPRFHGYQLDIQGIVVPAPVNNQFTLSFSAPAGLTPTSIKNQCVTFWTNQGFTALPF